MGKPAYKKINDKEINNLINSTNDSKIKENLDFVNNEILIKYDEDFTATIGKEAENAGRNSSKEHSSLAQEEIKKYDEYNKSISIEFGLIRRNDDTIEENSKEEFLNKITNEKIVLNDNTKNVLKEAFELLDELKNLDGTPLVSSDRVDNSGNIFKSLVEIKNRSKELVELNNPNSVNELSNLAIKYQKDSKTLSKLVNVMEKLGCDHFVANSSCSRHESMPIEFVENYKGASQINSLYVLACFIKTTGSTIDEYLDNPISIANKFNDKYKNFSEINEFGKEVGDIEFIEKMQKPSSVKELKEKMSDFKLQNGPMMRFLLASSMLQNENNAKNRMVADLYGAHIVGAVGLNKDKFREHYFKDNKAQTIKNILINTDKEKDYASLTASSIKIKDGYTGKHNEFNYSEYLLNGKVDTKALKEKFEKINESNNLEIKESLKEVAKDIVKCSTYDNSKEFDSLKEMSGLSYKDIINTRKGNKSLKNYINDRYNKINSNGLDKEKIGESLNLLKAMDENFKSRSWLGRHLWARSEGKLVNSIKDNLIKNGLDEKKLNDFLNNKSNKENILEENKIVKEETIKDISKPVRSKIEIKEVEKTNEKIVNKDTTLAKEKTNEKEL